MYAGNSKEIEHTQTTPTTPTASPLALAVQRFGNKRRVASAGQIDRNERLASQRAEPLTAPHVEAALCELPEEREDIPRPENAPTDVLLMTRTLYVQGISVLAELWGSPADLVSQPNDDGEAPIQPILMEQPMQGGALLYINPDAPRRLREFEIDWSLLEGQRPTRSVRGHDCDPSTLLIGCPCPRPFVRGANLEQQFVHYQAISAEASEYSHAGGRSPSIGSTGPPERADTSCLRI